MSKQNQQQTNQSKLKPTEETVIHIRTIRANQHVDNGMFITFVVSELKKLGASVWVGRSQQEAVLRIQDIEPSKVNDLVPQLAGYYRDTNPVHIVQRQVPATPLPGEKGEELPLGTALRERLTKRLLMILPTGSRIISNCFGTGFNEVLGPRETREETWKRAVKMRAAGRTFMCLPPGDRLADIYGDAVEKRAEAIAESLR